MSRATCDDLRAYTGRVYIRRERLNSGGYTSDGCYFGVGSPLYFAQDYDGLYETYIRARCRQEAVDKMRQIYPNAKIKG